MSLNRFEAKKNIELALEAFAMVKKERSGTRMRLVVAGMSRGTFEGVVTPVDHNTIH